MKKFRSVLLMAILAFPAGSGSAIAGGVSGEVQIESVSPAWWGESIIQFIQHGDVSAFPQDCEVVTLRSRYRPRRWLSGRVSREEHETAIAFLKDAVDQDSTIRFGVVFEGFEPACSVRSHALRLMTESDGQQAVIAYF